MPNGAHSGLGRGRFFVKVGPTPAPWRLALHSGLSSTWSRPHGARAEEPTNGSIRTMPPCRTGMPADGVRGQPRVSPEAGERALGAGHGPGAIAPARDHGDRARGFPAHGGGRPRCGRVRPSTVIRSLSTLKSPVSGEAFSLRSSHLLIHFTISPG